MKFLERVVAIIEFLNEQLGRFAGWLMAALVALVTLDVVSRYLFNTGAVAVQEAEWWMFSIIFLLGAGYTQLHGGHVRVDIIYSRLNEKWKNVVDLVCAFIFLFPMCALVMWTSKRYIEASWEVREFSPDPGGLPAYYVLKAFIPLGFFLLSLQGAAEVFHIARRFMGIEARQEERKGL